MIDNPKLYDVARLICHQHGMDWTDPRTGKLYPAPAVSDADILAWCDMVEQEEHGRTFARDDLAPGNPAARKHQALMLRITRRLRDAITGGH